ncbi:MAG TPA: phosphate signaling complex protein PhoU [Burkholderiales bacterium]|nr:phosphate signaling complex protein PhoU [Burkholderiales bacterium]
MQSTAHSSKDYDADLLALRSRVLEAGAIVEYQIRYAIEALRTGDRSLVARVIADEERVNRLEREIDEACTHVIARRAPAAGDLRLLIMVYKAITDLERVGDEAKKIALVAREVRLNERLTPGFPEIKMVSTVVIEMLRRALDGLARLEAEDAPEIARMDRDVDRHFKSIVRQLLTYMIEDPRTISPALDLVFVAKALERIGDHAKNISEYVVFMIKGRDVRHLPLGEMEQVARV